MKRIISTLAVLVVLSLIVGALWWLTPTSLRSPSAGKENTNAGAAFSEDAPSSEDSLADMVIPEGSLIYKDKQYRFALAYPKELSVKEYTEVGGGRTITFQDANGELGFQIFVFPYNDEQITSSRIQKDTYGTAVGTPQEIVLGDNIRALLFESVDPLLGNVREIWLLHSGMLYEVTSYPDLDPWLMQILNTWRFL